MASHPRRPVVAILDQVTNAYGILNTPIQDDRDAYVQVYGRCHLDTKEDISTIQQRLTVLENASVVVPVPSPKGSLDTESHSSTIEDIHHELREMDDRLKDFEEVATRRLTDVEDLVNEVKDGVQDQFDRLSNDVDEAEVRVTERVDELEKHMDESFMEVEKRFGGVDKRLDDVDKRFDGVDKRFDDVDKRFDGVDKRFDDVDKRFDGVDKRFDDFDKRFDNLLDCMQSQEQNAQAFRENSMADRFFTHAKLVGVEHQDANGFKFYKFPPGRSRSIRYYWRMHQPRNQYKLRALHEFYGIYYADWAIDEELASDEDEGLDQPNHPASASEAIANYPGRAVRVLFTRLGLNYSRFEKQAEKLEAMGQEPGKAVEKRATATRAALPLAPKTKVRKRNPSWGSTTESLPRSSTQSQE